MTYPQTAEHQATLTKMCQPGSRAELVAEREGLVVEALVVLTGELLPRLTHLGDVTEDPALSVEGRSPPQGTPGYGRASPTGSGWGGKWLSLVGAAVEQLRVVGVDQQSGFGGGPQLAQARVVGLDLLPVVGDHAFHRGDRARRRSVAVELPVSTATAACSRLWPGGLIGTIQ